MGTDGSSNAVESSAHNPASAPAVTRDPATSNEAKDSSTTATPVQNGEGKASSTVSSDSSRVGESAKPATASQSGPEFDSKTTSQQEHAGELVSDASGNNVTAGEVENEQTASRGDAPTDKSPSQPSTSRQDEDEDYGPHRPQGNNTDEDTSEVDGGEDDGKNGEPTEPQLDAHSKTRAKLYFLTDGGQWDDRGTGYVQCLPPSSKTDHGVILLKQEADDAVVLNSKVHEMDIYNRQGDTLIMWCDPESQVEMALSFQEKEGCTEIWDTICMVQRGQGSSGDADSIEIPAIDIAHLPELAEVLGKALPAQHKAIAEHMLKVEALPALLDIFHQCEDLEDEDSLAHLYAIFKAILLLNDSGLYDIMFDENKLIDYVGPFEYDPEVTPNLRVSHRDFLRKEANLKEVIPFNNDGVLRQVHLNYRLQYLRDVVFARILDDQSYGSIHSFVYFANWAIVQDLRQDSAYLSRLFDTLLKSADATKLHDTLTLLFEFCTMVKVLSPDERHAFYAVAIFKGLFPALERCLGFADRKVRLLAAEIINTVLAHDSWLLRTHLLSDKQKDAKYSFLGVILDALLNDRDSGLKDQVADILKVLVDIPDGSRPVPGRAGTEGANSAGVNASNFTNGQDADGAAAGAGDGAGASESVETSEETKAALAAIQTNVTKDAFLAVFYEEMVPRLVEPLELASPPTAGNGSASVALKSTRSSRVFHVLELFSFFAQHHTYRIKYFLLRTSLLQRVMKLLGHRDRFVVLAVVRFFRTLLGLKDNYYNKHIVKNKLFTPLVEAFKRNGRRYNLLNSSILELFSFVEQDNNKDLIAHLVENYGHEFRDVSYVTVFQDLIRRHEQNQEPAPDTALPAGREAGEGGSDAVDAANKLTLGQQLHRRARQAEMDDAYFESGDDDDDPTASEVTSVASSVSDDDYLPIPPSRRRRALEVTPQDSSPLAALQAEYSDDTGRAGSGGKGNITERDGERPPPSDAPSPKRQRTG